MNSRQKETLEVQIKNEKTAIRDLKKQYEKALTDINAKIRALQTDEITQSKIYQIEYQKALKGQIEAILDNLNSNQYDSISDYLNKSYEDGFIGTLYDLQGQGIPLIFPINQDQVARAIITNSKISEGLYKKLGVDTTALKKAIRTELTRGIAQGMSYTDMARNIENQIRIGLNRAIRIARTEGHRISIESSLDAMHKAKDRGADIVKQWDATMDGRTRPHHRELDGQIRELDEPFEVAGMKVNAPHQFGKASEDVNCRCVVLQRARWAIDDEEYTKMNGETNELVHLKESTYRDFKKAYKKAVEDVPLRFDTKQEAIDHFTKSGITFKDSRKYPVDEKYITECANWHESFNKKFSEFDSANVCYIPQLNMLPPSKMNGGRTLGFYQSYLNNNRVIQLSLNAQEFSNADYAIKHAEQMFERGWQSGKNAVHTFIHEYGHHVSNSMKWTTNNPSWEHQFISECVQEFHNTHEDVRGYWNMGKFVSNYGSTSESELFAEAFAEYFGEDEPREFAKLFGEKLESAMKGIKK